MNRSTRYYNHNTKDTSTPDEFSLCRRCRQTECGSTDAPSTIINDYIDSLRYINSCHVLINQIIQGRNPAQKISLPQMPNFLNVVTHIAKDVRGLTDLKTLESLEHVMTENMSDAASSLRRLTKKEKDEGPTGLMADKEVGTPRLQCTHAETSMKKVACSADPRYTGIPMRINGNAKVNKNRGRQHSPCTIHGSSSETSRLGRQKSIIRLNSLGGRPLSAKPRVCLSRDHSPERRRMSEARNSENENEIENSAESSVPSNDEMTEYAKQILLASETTQSASVCSSSSRPKYTRSKVRKVKSKTARDYAMIKNFLKQWGMEMPVSMSDSDESIITPNAKSTTHIKPCDKQDCYVKHKVVNESAIGANDDSDVDTIIMEAKMMKKHSSSKDSKCSNENGRINNTFNDLAAAAVGMENTFITNEKPVWSQSQAPPTNPHDESDIEPDLEKHIMKTHGKHIHVVSATMRHSKTISFQNNAHAAYMASQKTKDKVYIHRRGRSQSEESEHIFVDSDVDDEIFEKRIRRSAPSQRRQPVPVLPPTVLSNIGILTQTGQVKPEKELQLQELRSRLATDMQTSLFRKPRNRKLETDIVHLLSDIPSGN